MNTLAHRISNHSGYSVRQTVKSFNDDHAVIVHLNSILRGALHLSSRLEVEKKALQPLSFHNAFDVLRRTLNVQRVYRLKIRSSVPVKLKL